MPRIDTQHYEIYLVFCESKLDPEDVHWMIVLIRPGADQCVKLHCEGAPSRRRCAIQTNTEFEVINESDTWNIKTKIFISQIPRQLVIQFTNKQKLRRYSALHSGRYMCSSGLSGKVWYLKEHMPTGWTITLLKMMEIKTLMIMDRVTCGLRKFYRWTFWGLTFAIVFHLAYSLLISNLI